MPASLVFTTVALLLGSDAGTAAAKPAAAPAPFSWTAPAGWKSERIPFPLDFAPELALRGVEELRFAPGMFDASQPGYFSYAFIWWVEDGAVLDARAINAMLVEYFRGLTHAVKGPDAGTGATFRATLKRTDGSRLLGAVDAYDPFSANAPVHLNALAEVRPCAGTGHTAVMFQISPKPAADPIWKGLGGVAASFRCPR